jgi:hypothetical protein
MQQNQAMNAHFNHSERNMMGRQQRRPYNNAGGGQRPYNNQRGPGGMNQGQNMMPG